MREALIQFVRDAGALQTGQNREDTGGPYRRHQFTLGEAGGYGPSIAFGYGYFERGKVYFTEGNGTGCELTVEEAVDRFLAAYDLDK